MSKPCNHKDNEYIETCYICNLVLKNPAYRKLYLSSNPSLTLKQPEPPCMFLGKRVRDENNKVKQILCTEGCPKGKMLDVFNCEIYGEITLTKCIGCPLKKVKKATSPQNTTQIEKQALEPVENQKENLKYLNDKIGIVIGCKNWPNLMELQIKTIKHNCGNIPILLADDFSDGCKVDYDKNSTFGKLMALTEKYDKVTLWPNPVAFGHNAGDLSVFTKGLTWAKKQNLKYLAKLSRRLVVDIPYWVQYWTNNLAKDNHVIAIQKQNLDQWPFSTQGVILNTDYWFENIHKFQLGALNSLKSNLYVENVFCNIIEDSLEGTYSPFGLLSKSPSKKNPGVLWHTSNTLEEYKTVFEKYGLEMDSSFSTLPSGQINGFKIG